MVSKKPAQGPKPHHSAHLSSKISVQPSTVLLSSFSPSNLGQSLFASTILGLDAQRLRIHDTTTGRLRCEYVFEKGSSCNSLAWGSTPAESEDAADKKNKKKKRKRLSDSTGEATQAESTIVLALGMNKGTILLFSSTEGKIVGSLEGAHAGEVTAFQFSETDNNKGWSCGTDGKLVEWDLRQRLAIRTTPLPDAAIRTISPASPLVLCASHTVYGINPESPGSGSPPKFTANSTPIHTILPSADGTLFLSAADSDRYVNVFSISQQKQLGALVAESDVKQLSINAHGNTALLAAVTANGTVELFSDPWKPAPSEAATGSPVRSRKSKGTTRKADSKIRVIRPKTSELVAILNASFQSDGELTVAWVEGGVNIEFESVQWKNAEDGTMALQGVVDIVKSKVSGLGNGVVGQMNGVKAMGKTNVDQSRTVVVSGVDTQDFGMVDASDADADSDADVVDSDNEGARAINPADEPSFFDKFQALEVSAANNLPSKPSKSVATTAAANKISKPFSGSLTTVLTQALKTNDYQLLESCFVAAKEKSILSTIRRLDSTLAVTLIEKLAERIAQRPGRASQLGAWIRWTIVAHGGYLVSLPNLMGTLAGLHSVLATRAGSLPKLLQLQGRLDMLSAQLELRKSLRLGTGETGVDLYEEEEQKEEGVLYIEGKTKEDSDDSEDDGSDEEPEEVGMEGLQIEDASFIQGRDNAVDYEDELDEASEDDEEDEGESDMLNGVLSDDDENDDEEEEDEDEEEEEEDGAERYGGLVDDEAEESDNDEEGSDLGSDEEPSQPPQKPVATKKSGPKKR
ncbi:WD40-repeat-containing domain protein [Peziza echinospora]|nr:WD40-repeat-containing domain protein [Peziza echinospora]